MVGDVLTISSKDRLLSVKENNLVLNNVKKVIIKQGVEDIPMEAFCGMNNLLSLELPYGLKKNRFWCFYELYLT